MIFLLRKCIFLTTLLLLPPFHFQANVHQITQILLSHKPNFINSSYLRFCEWPVIVTLQQTPCTLFKTSLPSVLADAVINLFRNKVSNIRLKFSDIALSNVFSLPVVPTHYWNFYLYSFREISVTRFLIFCLAFLEETIFWYCHCQITNHSQT